MSHKIPETIPMKESYIHYLSQGGNDYVRIHPDYQWADPVVVLNGKTYKTWEFYPSKEPLLYDFYVTEYHWDQKSEDWREPTPTTIHKFSKDDLLGATIKLKRAKKWNAFVDEIEVGDFVQFSGQRDSTSWRKIITIDLDKKEVFGFKYSKPIDDPKYDERYSSSNAIWFIKKLVKAKEAVA